jgi:hypothetical protein
MSARGSSFDKLQRDRDKKARAAAKRERRQERTQESRNEDGDGDQAGHESGDVTDTSDLLRMIDLVHEQYEAGIIDLEEYEHRKADLLGRISVD